MFLPNSPGAKISLSYTRLLRKVPFGTGGFHTGSRNLVIVANQQAEPAPFLTRQLPGER